MNGVRTRNIGGTTTTQFTEAIASKM